MNHIFRYLVLPTLLLTMLQACSGMPKLFWDTEDGRGGAAVAKTPAESESPHLASRPIEQSKRELPMAERVGGHAAIGELPEKYSKLLNGDSVATVARSYKQSIAGVYSAAVDAMVSLNIPLESVDSANGILASDWVRKGENSLVMPDVTNYTRHRYVIHVRRAASELGDMTILEVHVVGQFFEKSKWIDRLLERKVSDELFMAVEEQLSRMHQ